MLFPLVSIQILNWNRGEETLRAIESAKEQTYPNKEIIVVDNGSDDNSVELITKHYPEVTVIRLDKNYGCPGGRNRGIKHCNGRYIFYLDNDGVLHQNAVEFAVKSIEKEKSIKIVTGKVYPFEKEHEIDTTFSVEDLLPNEETRAFQGGVCMHDKSLYKEIGVYPDDFFYGGEEGHLAIRVLAKGYKIVQNPAVILWHVQSKKARDKKNEQVQAFINRYTTVYQLYPFFLVLLFSFKYLFHYTYLSLRSGFGKLFIQRSLKELPSRVIRSRRKPLSLNEIKIYFQLPLFK